MINSNVTSFADLNVKDKDFRYEIRTLKGEVTQALTGKKCDELIIEKESITLEISQIDRHYS
jgi:hypothetical protein